MGGRRLRSIPMNATELGPIHHKSGTPVSFLITAVR
jgi:hypothetical protein